MDAVVPVPEGTELSAEAIETIRHLRHYRDAREGFFFETILFSTFPFLFLLEALLPRCNRASLTV